MERIGEDDRYGALVKFCRPTSSQEQKLQTCHFARADETFPAAFDSLGSSFSQALTQSPPPVITMVSLSDSDEDEEPPNDENALVENEEYQTPPEEHNTSYCSSQEEIQRNLQLVPVIGEKTEAEIGKDGDDATAQEILGFPEQSGEARGAELNEFGVSEGDSGEPPWRKIRVLGVNWESPVLNTVEEEEEKEEEVIAFQKACDYAEVVDDGELIDMVIEESDEEIGPNGAGNDGEGMSDSVKSGGEKIVSSDGDLVVEEAGNHKKSVSSDGDLVEEVRNDSGVKLAGMDREDIYAFKYDTGSGGGGGENGDQHWKEVVRKKRELPASMREKGSDKKGQRGDKGGDTGDVDTKDLSWKELFDRLSTMVKKKKVDCDAEEENVDFLKTAKKRGMTFPQPRWKVA